jgi:hypothetical protein
MLVSRLSYEEKPPPISKWFGSSKSYHICGDYFQKIPKEYKTDNAFNINKNSSSVYSTVR